MNDYSEFTKHELIEIMHSRDERIKELEYKRNVTGAKPQCKAIIQPSYVAKPRQCSRKAAYGSEYCYSHRLADKA